MDDTVCRGDFRSKDISPLSQYAFSSYKSDSGVVHIIDYAPKLVSRFLGPLGTETTLDLQWSSEWTTPVHRDNRRGNSNEVK